MIACLLAAVALILPRRFQLLSAVSIAFVVLLSLQGISMIARSILVLAGRDDLLPASQRYVVENNQPDSQGAA